ncbi:unnamed protein product [Allacma fusca]|uniref:Uncharacterized protein n=1 Tax=Allacma fusca TaxID=39272 RepID=A0A8J2JSI5_9HEXA|nr:unnamed protein product [Allacma fusca]
MAAGHPGQHGGSVRAHVVEECKKEFGCATVPPRSMEEDLVPDLRLKNKSVTSLVPGQVLRMICNQASPPWNALTLSPRTLFVLCLRNGFRK